MTGRSVLLILCLVLVWVFDAVGEDTFDSLRSRYITLRNTDIDIRRLDEWEGLLGALLGYVESNPAKKESATALFYAGILQRELAERASEEGSHAEAVRIFHSLVSTFPMSDLADDALLQISELEQNVRWGSRKREQRALERIVGEYSRSESAPVARERLNLLQSGGSLMEGASPSKRHKSADELRASTGKGRVIVIDPGHGGDDKGAVGVGGLFEKDVVLDIAFKLEAILEQKGFVVRLTRNSDEFVPLEARTRFANDYQAELFLSLHTNASPDRKLTGLQTFYLDNTDDQASRRLADRENAAGQEGVTSDDLRFIVSDLIQSAKLDDSIRLAHTLHRRLLANLKKSFGGVQDAGIRKGPFYVLVGAHMPCVLVELLFIDNPSDGKKLADSRFRKALAESLAEGIIEFLRVSDA